MAGFEIIPVIDLMGGVVVHARSGERDSYRPLTSPLAASAEPAEVVRGLLTLGRGEEGPRGPCDLARVVDEVASLVEPACRHSRVNLAIGPHFGTGKLMAD